MSQWQPISTAPKDGTPVLVACDRTASIRWAVWSDGFWRDGRHSLGGSICGCPDPTHWAPLPEPPSPPKPRYFAVLAYMPHGADGLEAGRSTAVFADTPENRKDLAAHQKEGKWLPFDLVERTNG